MSPAWKFLHKRSRTLSASLWHVSKAAPCPATKRNPSFAARNPEIDCANQLEREKYEIDTCQPRVWQSALRKYLGVFYTIRGRTVLVSHTVIFQFVSPATIAFARSGYCFTFSPIQKKLLWRGIAQVSVMLWGNYRHGPSQWLWIQHYRFAYGTCDTFPPSQWLRGHKPG